MSTAFEINLVAGAQSLSVPLSGGVYRLRLRWSGFATPSWLLDISTEAGDPLVSGLPMVTGSDLLAQHAHLNIGGGLYVVSDVDPPTYASLGVSTKLYFLPTA